MKKFTINTIKNLKVKVKDMNETLLNYYTIEAFIPDHSFHLVTEESDVLPINNTLVEEMIAAFVDVN